ncbi:MAG: hypothetical protein JXO72_11110, partial [Vicinamibacteria bacterium]|nr:hypothetical protein [Vicinamibacteria bacterium]
MIDRLKLLFAVCVGLALGAAGAGDAEAAKACRMKGPDLSVFGIKLNDEDSAVKQVGSGPAMTEDSEDLPRARFVSKDGVQELILYAHYGAPTDEYAEVEVRLAGTEAMTLKELPTEVFASGLGVALGMSPGEVVKRFGACIKSRDQNGDNETIQYAIEGADKDNKLKTYGYPTYYAEYEFRSEKLVRFRFGFEYP